ncbi:hypothetical protein BYT27DRAFT_7145257 [Phlegmacium glaucopus]|nr:hypothetical protein BYT27DRAFT_7145257 [Phlegmacium glaucopus]
MCRYRRVCNVYIQCGHIFQLPDELIMCHSQFCKFSANHSPTCVPPECTRKCLQSHQYPEQYSPNINGKCHPDCHGTA